MLLLFAVSPPLREKLFKRDSFHSITGGPEKGESFWQQQQQASRQ